MLHVSWFPNNTVSKHNLGAGFLGICRTACAALSNCNGFHVWHAKTICALVGENITADDTARAESAVNRSHGIYIFRSNSNIHHTYPYQVAAP